MATRNHHAADSHSSVWGFLRNRSVEGNTMDEQKTPALDTTPEPPAWRWAWTPVEPRPACMRFPKQGRMCELAFGHPAAPLPDESPEDRRRRRNRAKRVRRARRG